MARFKIDIKDGTSYKSKIKGVTLKEMLSWKRAYNKNYANGRTAPKRLGVEKITEIRRKR